MDSNRFGVFSIVAFLFYFVFMVLAFIGNCFIWTIGTPLSYMFIDDGARSLKRWHETL